MSSGCVSPSFCQTEPVRLYSNSGNISLQPLSHPDALAPCGRPDAAAAAAGGPQVVCRSAASSACCRRFLSQFPPRGE